MYMKKAVMVFAVVLCAAAGLYAEGRGEDSLEKYRNRVSVTGTLQFADGFPVISSDGKTYNLFAPHFTRQAYTLKPGMPLTVEGYIVQQGPRLRDGGAPPAVSEAIFVQKVTVDGKTFETYPGRPGGPYFGGGKNFHPGKGNWDGPRGEFCGNYRGYGEHRRDFRGPDRDGRGRRGPR
jgi:hypothetical protein